MYDGETGRVSDVWVKGMRMEDPNSKWSMTEWMKGTESVIKWIKNVRVEKR